MKKNNRSKQRQKNADLFFLLLYRVLQLIPLTLIFIGDSVILFTVTLLKTIRFIITFLIEQVENVKTFLRLVLHKCKKLLSKRRHKSRGTIFSYRQYERKINKQRKKRPFYLSFLSKLKYVVAGVIFSMLFIFLPLVAIIFIQDLPNPNQLTLEPVPQTTKIYDRNGHLLYQIYAQQNRTLVPLKDVPINLQHATIASEDKTFYSNPGFNILAIFRAAINDLSGTPTEGGSTITQQLIKSTLLTPQQTLYRKFKEVILAFWAERIYTKNQILEMYLNQVPYGGTAWGIEAASELYFSKHVQNLDLAQCAFLAGLTSSPSTYSPYGPYSNLWKKRQMYVLQQMVDDKYITSKEASAAAKETLTFDPQQEPYLAPHFVNYVINWLEQKYGIAEVEKGGLNVRTTLDLNIQNMAQNIVSSEVAKDNYLNLTNGAALITDPSNGDILAMVGSHDFNDPNGGNVNITTSIRQPGSSIKVVNYSAAFERGLTAATIIDDTPTTFTDKWGNSYTPRNYDGKFHGPVTVRTALSNSLNIPAVKVLNQYTGVANMVAMAKEMGIHSWGDPSQYGLSLTLGSADVTMLDMARVYGTLANEGTEVSLNPILKITDYKGDVIAQKDAATIAKRQVLDPGVAFIIGNILADNNARSMEFGPNSPLYIPGYYVPVKTGTTNNIRDNWTDGYTPNYVVITWVGNNNNSPMNNGLVSGITGAAPMWHQIMSNLLQGLPNPLPPIPADVVQKTCYGHPEFFVRGTENSVNCNYIPYPSGAPTPTH